MCTCSFIVDSMCGGLPQKHDHVHDEETKRDAPRAIYSQESASLSCIIKLHIHSGADNNRANFQHKAHAS